MAAEKKRADIESVACIVLGCLQVFRSFTAVDVGRYWRMIVPFCWWQ